VATTQQRTVMIVEDEPSIRGLLSLTLESERYHVETAQDGYEALTKIQESQPDLIVLDLMLPKLDGWCFIDTLSRGCQAGHIPIVAMTAGARHVTVGEQGVRAFLSKPFDLETLLVILQELFSERQ
jgi:CheY-like chemotaxis protein